MRRIQAAGDRMERLVSQLLRGTANDPRAHPVRLRPVGAAGMAYGLGASFDRRLRDRLRGIGVGGGLFIMQSNGGICEAETGCRYPG